MSLIQLTCRDCKQTVHRELDIDKPGLLESIAKDPETICNNCIKPETLDIEILTVMNDRGLQFPSEIAWFLGEPVNKIEQRLNYMVEANILFDKAIT